VFLTSKTQPTLPDHTPRNPSTHSPLIHPHFRLFSRIFDIFDVFLKLCTPHQSTSHIYDSLSVRTSDFTHFRPFLPIFSCFSSLYYVFSRVWTRLRPLSTTRKHYDVLATYFRSPPLIFDAYRPFLPLFPNLFRPFSTIFNRFYLLPTFLTYIQPFLTICDYFQPSVIVFTHFQSFSLIFSHFRSFSTVFTHIYSFSTIIDHPHPYLTVYTYFQLLSTNLKTIFAHFDHFQSLSFFFIFFARFYIVSTTITHSQASPLVLLIPTTRF
jgi:hypothetical protein